MSNCQAISHPISATILTSSQSVSLFGWFKQPILTLCWDDVKQNNFTWRQMRTLGLSQEQLRAVQPDKQEWVQRGGLQLSDIADMTIFPVNPLTDFGADLAELWNMKSSSQQLRQMGISFDNLLTKGLSAQIMHAFGFPLSGWTEIGFKHTHAAKMSEHEAQLVFGLPKVELVNILQKFDGTPSAGVVSSME